MHKLILLGGPPGVGKSSVVEHMKLKGVSCIDADDVTPPTHSISRKVAIERVIKTTRKAVNETNLVIVSWVFAKPELYQPFLDQFADCIVQQLYLVCSPDTLLSRLADRSDDSLNTFALERLGMISGLPFNQINTTEMDVPVVASKIFDSIRTTPNK